MRLTLDVWSLLERTFGWGGVVAFHGVGDDPPSRVMHVSPTRLRDQLTYLRDRYSVLPLRELVQRWHSRRSTRGCVAITFDDAYVGVAVYALPVLSALDLPATVFVTSNHAMLGASYWWDDLEGQHSSLNGQPAKHAGVSDALARSAIPHPSIVERAREQVLLRFAGRWPAGIAPGGTMLWRSMNFEELRALGGDDRIEFGVHTLSHPALPMLPYDEQVTEMRHNLEVLRNQLPRVLPVVAYPYGLYDQTTVRAALQAGMIAGLTMEGRATADHPNPMIAPRIGAGEAHTPLSLAHRLNRGLRLALVVRNRGVHPRVPSAKWSMLQSRPTWIGKPGNGRTL